MYSCVAQDVTNLNNPVQAIVKNSGTIVQSQSNREKLKEIGKSYRKKLSIQEKNQKRKYEARKQNKYKTLEMIYEIIPNKYVITTNVHRLKLYFFKVIHIA